MSEPLLVKATEWNDTKLKQQDAAENECLIKAVPDTFPDLLQKADLASADNMETVEYSQDVAKSASRISSQFVMKYMHKVIAGIAKAEPSEELAKHKQVVKQEFAKVEFWFLSQFHHEMQTYCQLGELGFDATASAEQQAQLMVENFGQIKTDACLAPYLLNDDTSFVKGKSYLDYGKSLLQFVQSTEALCKSAHLKSFSDNIADLASQWMLGGNVEQKLVCNVLEAVGNVKNGFDDGRWSLILSLIHI